MFNWFSKRPTPVTNGSPATKVSPAGHLSVDDQIKIYNVFREYVKREGDNIDNRLSLILVIHGFLYTAYGLTLQAIADTKNSSTAQAFIPSNRLEAFLLVISFTGIAINIIGIISIGHAQRAMTIVKEIFDTQYRPSPFGENL